MRLLKVQNATPTPITKVLWFNLWSSNIHRCLRYQYWINVWNKSIQFLHPVLNKGDVLWTHLEFHNKFVLSLEHTFFFFIWKVTQLISTSAQAIYWIFHFSICTFKLQNFCIFCVCFTFPFSMEMIYFLTHHLFFNSLNGV